MSASHLLIATKKSFSAKNIERQLNHNRYQPTWHTVHKLRQYMVKRVEEYVLAVRIDLDEGNFSTETPEEEKEKPLKIGIGVKRNLRFL